MNLALILAVLLAYTINYSFFYILLINFLSGP